MGHSEPNIGSNGQQSSEGRPPLGCLIGLILIFLSPGLISLAVVLPILNPRWRPIGIGVMVALTALLLVLAWAVGVFGRGRGESGPLGLHPDGERRDR